MKYLIIVSCLTILLAASCKKNKSKTELEKLPSITQIGANTFGCLINGKAWIPENENLWLTTPPLRFYYENYRGGQFSIRAKLQIGNTDQSINIGIDSCISSKNYIFNTLNYSRRVSYHDYKLGDCTTYFSSVNDIATTGYMIITRFDLQNGIVSGTFEFTLSKTGCKTISITNGRFDAKL